MRMNWPIRIWLSRLANLDEKYDTLFKINKTIPNVAWFLLLGMFAIIAPSPTLHPFAFMDKWDGRCM
jgi:hypothetical protein